MVRVHPIVFLVDVDNTLLDNDGGRRTLILRPLSNDLPRFAAL